MGVGYIKGITYYIEKMKTERDDHRWKGWGRKGRGSLGERSNKLLCT